MITDLKSDVRRQSIYDCMQIVQDHHGELRKLGHECRVLLVVYEKLRHLAHPELAHGRAE